MSVLSQKLDAFRALDRPTRALLTLWLLVLTAMILLRTLPGFIPYTAETDWKQWLWLYHRYGTPGTFPAGHLLTDYAINVQPPLFHAVCAALSWLTSPVIAAVLLYALAMVLAAFCAWWAARSRVSMPAALLAAVIVLHGYAYFKHASGGYPRSFGPTLTLWFLAAWMNGRHRQVLLAFVVMGALYPSVLVPCGLGYGAWSVLFAGRAKFIPRNLLLAAAGGVAVVLAQMQSLMAPDWYGDVVTMKEALEMPALGKQGRTWWVPLPDFWDKTWGYVLQPLRASGALPLGKMWPHEAIAAQVLWSAVLVLAVLGLRKLRQVQKPWKEALATIPYEPLLLVAGAVCAHVMARELAFKLYLPHRVVQHVIPYTCAVLVAVVVGRALTALVSERRALLATALWAPLAFFAVAADGMFAGGFQSYAVDKPLYEWVEQNTPVQAQFAGTVRVLDELPFFSKRQPFVNWKMAHPFRKGFYAEIERRILAMYDAYYATRIEDVLAFCDKEKIDYFVIDARRYQGVEQGDGNLFEPLRGKVLRTFDARKADGFALLNVPKDAVVFAHRTYRVIEVARLRPAPTPAP